MNKGNDKYLNHFFQSFFVCLLLSFVLKIIPFENQTLKTIVEILFSLAVCLTMFFIYIAFKFRILLINFYWFVLMFNLSLLTVDSFGMRLFSLDYTIKILEFLIVMLEIGVIFFILGIISIKFKLKWISDIIDYSVKRILIETVSFTIFFQWALRYVVNNHV